MIQLTVLWVSTFLHFERALFLCGQYALIFGLLINNLWFVCFYHLFVLLKKLGYFLNLFNLIFEQID